MHEKSGLTIRRHARHEIELPAELVVDDEHCGQIRFSTTSGAGSVRTLPATTIDLSAGGVGLSSRIFLPRGCRGTLRVFDPTPVSSKSQGAPVREVLFEHSVQTRRVALTGHDPTYFVGVAFVDKEPNLAQVIDDIVQRASAAIATIGGGEPRA